jgi:hypothetical protein
LVAPEPYSKPETLAALLLGRFQAGIAGAGTEVLHVLAARSVRESLIAVLRQEGHEFTEDRFFAWYAGLDTLSDHSTAHLRPAEAVRPKALSPKALCQAILTELRHNSWTSLATAAATLQQAFMAPEDFNGGADHEDAHATIAAARQVVEALKAGGNGLPFVPVERLFSGAAQSLHFAREDNAIELAQGIDRDESVAIERRGSGNSRWALDLLAGGYLSPHHGLPIALPLPGLVALPLVTSPLAAFEADEDNLADHAVVSLHDTLARLDRWLGDAKADVATMRSRLENRRSSGRAQRLAEYLAGFGPLRGTQIERVIGVSRPGVRVVTSTLEASGLVHSQTTRNATRLYLFAPGFDDALPSPLDRREVHPSCDAIADYEKSMRALDELLSRSTFGAGQD